MQISNMVIYKTTNLINGKFYIGFDSLNRSIKQYPGSGIKLKLAIKKYGIENFEKTVLEKVNEDNWQDREKYWISKFNAQIYGYNIANGGDGGSTRKGYINSKNMRKNISKSLKNKLLSEKHKKSLRGIPKTESHKNKLKEIMSGRTLTKEHKENVSKSLKGREITKEHREKLSKVRKGIKFSDEWKNNISKRKISKETRDKISKARSAMKGSKIWVTNKIKPIRINIDLLEKYLNIGYIRGRKTN